MTATSPLALAPRRIVSRDHGLAHRRVAVAIALAVLATVVGSIVPVVAHHTPHHLPGIVSAVMLAFEIGAYTASLMLVIARLREMSKAPLGRGSSHL